MNKRLSRLLLLMIISIFIVWWGLLPPDTGFASQLPTLPFPLPSSMPTLPTSMPTINITPTITVEIPPIPEMCNSWRVEIDIPVPANDIPDSGIESGAQELENELLQVIEDLPINASVTSTPTKDGGAVYTVTLEGYSVELLRQVLFVILQPIVDVMNYQIDLFLSGQAETGDTIQLLLDIIASTGSQWQLDLLDDIDIQETSTLECSKTAPGAPQEQTIDLEILEDGEIAFRLLYKQLWEELNEQSPVRITMNLCEFPDEFILTDPSPSKVSVNPPLASEPGPLGDQGTGGTPSTFNWATSNNRLGQPMVTSVKQQGQCGSCWSFASVGIMESAIKIQGSGPDTNLSEQYLVSCNNDGWGCGGGWWAHDYHINKAGQSSNPPGAVMESSMPYTESDSSCVNISSHPYLLSSWHSAGDESLQSVSAIKAAIYNYGPVAAAVCASDSFMRYSGGVYTTQECSSINHAIILTGWDDGTQSWVLKNSWGTGWGEGGYMRIRWGVNAVGNAANYVMYAGSGPSQPTPTDTPKPASPTPSNTSAPGKNTPTRTPTPSNTPVSPPTKTPTPSNTPVTQPTKTSTNTNPPAQATPTSSKTNTLAPPPPAVISPTTKPSSTQPTSTSAPGKTGTQSPANITPSSSVAPGGNTATQQPSGSGTPIPPSQTGSPAPPSPAISATPSPTANLTKTVETGTPQPVKSIEPILPPGKFDDAYPAIIFTGNWHIFNSQLPYEGTIHYSTLINSSASFAFNGTGFSIGYTAYPHSGVVLLFVDNELTMMFNQFSYRLKWQEQWDSPELEPGQHVVTIQHILGPQINIDYIIVR